MRDYGGVKVILVGDLSPSRAISPVLAVSNGALIKRRDALQLRAFGYRVDQIGTGEISKKSDTQKKTRAA